MRLLASGLLVLAVCVCAGPVQAHHPGHAVSVRTVGQYNPFLEGTGGPRKSLTYTFDWSHLDNGAGNMYLNQISGEYAFFDWLSVTGRIPVIALRMNFRPNKTGLGDVAVGVKGQLIGGEKNALILGTEFSFPTGSRSAGTGAGAVVTSPFLSYQHEVGPVQLFASLGTSVQLASDPEPLLLPIAGLAIPIIESKVSVTGFLSLRSVIFFADESFTTGSAKGLLVPGLIIYPQANKKLSVAISGTISVIDTLAVKSGVVIQNSSLALTQDVKAGASLELTYIF